MTTRVQRSAAVVAAFGIALSTAAIGAPAFAASVSNETATTASLPYLNPTTLASLTIHKRLGAEGDKGDGTLITGTIPGTGISDVGYRIDQVDADLTTNDGRRAAFGLTPGEATIKVGGATAATFTNDNGEASFGNLPVGVYLVTETSVPDGSGLVAAPPFLVFLPMTTPDGNSWNYNVHVYPKNSKQTATKTVVDKDKNAGDKIEYAVTGTVPPKLDSTSSTAKYEFSDTLDADNVYITKKTDIAVSVDGTLLGADDYDVYVDDVLLESQPIAIPTAAEQKIVVSLTQNGLAKLAGKNEVRLTINATVKPVEGTDGAATNEASIAINEGLGAIDAVLKTDEVVTHWGKIKIQKTGIDESGTSVNLTGAEFKIYQADTCTLDSLANETPLTLGRIAAENPDDTWTTENGVAIIDGLHVTDYVNNSSALTQEGYCLVETKAPAGYELLPAPVAVSLNLTEIATDRTKVVEIENVASVSSQLPSTGGMGVGLLIAAGVGLVGAGAYAAKRNNDKSGAAEA